MRLPIATVAVCVAVLLAGCEASVSTGGDDGPKTLKKPDIGFTFEYQSPFREQKVDAANTQGTVLALLGIDDNNLIAVRRLAPKETGDAAELKAATVSFATQNGVPASAVKMSRRSGIDVASFETATTVDGTNTANAEYVFPAGGATWQLECQSTPDHATDVRKACDAALDSIKPK
jgi:hypothetical protein